MAKVRTRKAQEREEATHAKALKREEAAWLKAERTALLARERALKAARAPKKRESQRDQVSTTAESAEARQTKSHPTRGGRGEEVSSSNVDKRHSKGSSRSSTSTPQRMHLLSMVTSSSITCSINLSHLCNLRCRLNRQPCFAT